MFTERPTRTDDELRLEFAKMLRAQFIMWLTDQDQEEIQELEKAAVETGAGTGIDWDVLRKELAARYDV